MHIGTSECVMHTIYNQDVASWLQSAGKFKSTVHVQLLSVNVTPYTPPPPLIVTMKSIKRQTYNRAADNSLAVTGKIPDKNCQLCHFSLGQNCTSVNLES